MRNHRYLKAMNEAKGASGIWPTSRLRCAQAIAFEQQNACALRGVVFELPPIGVDSCAAAFAAPTNIV